MFMEQATNVRKEWSSFCDGIIHNKPIFIKRTRDKMWFSNLDTMADMSALQSDLDAIIKKINGASA